MLLTLIEPNLIIIRQEKNKTAQKEGDIMNETKKAVECWAGRYKRRDLALEILRNTPGILTMAEALERADAKGGK